MVRQTFKNFWGRAAASFFSPQREALGFDARELTPGLIERIVHVAAETRSYFRGEIVMDKVAGTKVADNTIERVALDVGRELAERRDADPNSAEALARRPEEPPAMAVVECDGGRIRVRQPGQGRGVHLDSEGWRETKIACLIHAKFKTFEEDPQPEPPECFCDPKHVAKLAETQALSVAAPRSVAPPSDEQVAESLLELDDARHEDWRPERVLRTVVGSMANSREFGRQMAREAKTRRFGEARAKVFLGDGLGWNWTIHKSHFSHYTAILDFIHPLSYLHVTAKAVHCEVQEDAWSQYLAWMRGCWCGEVDQVLAELKSWQVKLGQPEAATPDTDPRAVLATTITYLTNNRERMKYPEYRRRGMPVTTAWMESLVKEMNYRVKGTEMYWNDPAGAEAILQIRAAALSDDDRLTRHAQSRRGSPFTRRPKAPKVKG